MKGDAQARGYADPVVAGVCLGLLLFGVIMLAGRGLGASGAFASSAAAAVHAVAPRQAEAHPYLSAWIPTGAGGLLGDWTVLELLGVGLGAWLSARFAGRLRHGVERIGTESRNSRVTQARNRWSADGWWRSSRARLHERPGTDRRRTPRNGRMALHSGRVRHGVSRRVAHASRPGNHVVIAPLFDAPSGLLASPVGVAFGVTLERAGLGSAHTIADQLRGRDFTVVKVMFAAIVTAMLGVFWADRLGWLDLSRVAIPTTDLVPQLIGAILFGAGFAIASLCPGTACVSAATGARDGLAVIGGLFAGTLVVALLWTKLGPIAQLAPKDAATLPGDFGVPSGIIVAAITIAALVAIAASARIVAHLGGVSSVAPLRLSPLAAIALALGTLAAASGNAPLASNVALQGIGAAVDSETDHVDAPVLAEWIRARRPKLRIIDVRVNLGPDDYRIPGAEDVPLHNMPQLSLHSGETIVLYGDGADHAAQAWLLLRLRGVRNAFVLRDGVAAWEDDVLSPRAPSADDTAAVRRFQHVRELATWFGGKPSNRGESSTAKSAEERPRRKKAC